MKQSGQLWKRVLHPWVGLVLLLLLLGQCVRVAWMNDGYRYLYLGEKLGSVASTLFGERYWGRESTNQRIWPAGFDPDDGWLIFAEVTEASGAVRVLPPSELRERFGEQIIDRLKPAFSRESTVPSPIELGPNAEATAVCIASISFWEEGLWTPTLRTSIVRIGVAPILGPDGVAAGQHVAEGGEIDVRMSELLESFENVLRTETIGPFLGDDPLDSYRRTDSAIAIQPRVADAFSVRLADPGWVNYGFSGRETDLLSGRLWAAVALINALWLLCCLPGMAFLPVRYSRRFLRKRRGQCIGCGYDRHGVASLAPCPECGHTPHADSTEKH